MFSLVFFLLSVCLSICPSICPSVCLSACLCICLWVFLSLFLLEYISLLVNENKKWRNICDFHMICLLFIALLFVFIEIEAFFSPAYMVWVWSCNSCSRQTFLFHPFSRVSGMWCTWKEYRSKSANIEFICLKCQRCWVVNMIRFYFCSFCLSSFGLFE